jgi:hypothetical protein
MSSYRLTALSALCLASLLFACGGDGSDGKGPCDGDSAPEGCGASCSESNPCPSGLFCGDDGTCTADCTPSGGECDEGEECSATGECEPGGSDDGDNADDGSDDGGDDSGDDCPSVQVDLTPVVPVVNLLIDQSGSMNDDFPNTGDPSRWDAVQAALIGSGNDQGVLFQLQTSLNMGVTLYTSQNGNSGGTCPQLQEVAPRINNAANIAALLEANDPVEDTPTAESINAVVAAFPASDNPRVIVLATDGLPDTCVTPDPETPEAQTGAESAVQAAFAAGIQVFILSVGPDIAVNHLRRMANAGQGFPLDDTTEDRFFQALDPAQLVTAFEEIVGGIRSCDITVDGTVDLDRADEGTVVLNGTELAYGTAWTMADEHTIRLLADACDTFLSANSVELTAEFPCGGVDVD